MNYFGRKIKIMYGRTVGNGQGVRVIFADGGEDWFSLPFLAKGFSLSDDPVDVQTVFEFNEREKEVIRSFARDKSCFNETQRDALCRLIRENPRMYA